MTSALAYRKERGVLGPPWHADSSNGWRLTEAGAGGGVEQGRRAAGGRAAVGTHHTADVRAERTHTGGVRGERRREVAVGRDHAGVDPGGARVHAAHVTGLHGPGPDRGRQVAV